MTNVLKALCDIIFSFGAFMMLMAALLIFAFYRVYKDEEADRALAAKCIEQQMIAVDIAGSGRFCVVPGNIVKVK